jgi:Ser/Thr protein kinase RdoA (MazF antagonist)
MKPPLARDLAGIGGSFRIDGECVACDPYGNGHINDTYLASYRGRGGTARYIHQRINDEIFKDPPALMENVRRVLEHLERKQADVRDLSRRTIALVPAKDGKPYHRDAEGHYWRTFNHVEGGRSYDVVETPRQAREAAKAFGRFQGLLTDLPAPRLHDTIPDFHHTPKRFEALERAIEKDAAGRARLARKEIDFAFKRKADASVLEDSKRAGRLPERIAHNDTKINNVIIDEATQAALCVIDFDTVMPGLALHDFGDMVRTATSPAAEDERDLSKVTLQLSMFEALVRGYLETAGEFLTAEEKRLLPFSGKIITFETGIRFLADYLAGDVYFKIHRPEHNLDRCRTQFRLVESIEAQEAAMRRIVDAA